MIVKCVSILTTNIVRDFRKEKRLTLKRRILLAFQRISVVKKWDKMAKLKSPIMKIDFFKNLIYFPTCVVGKEWKSLLIFSGKSSEMSKIFCKQIRILFQRFYKRLFILMGSWGEYSLILLAYYCSYNFYVAIYYIVHE